MSDQPIGGGELSQFEQLSAITPKKTPLAIMIGAVLIVFILIIINQLAPTETVDKLRKAEATKATTEATTPAAGGAPAGDIDDI